MKLSSVPARKLGGKSPWLIVLALRNRKSGTGSLDLREACQQSLSCRSNGRRGSPAMNCALIFGRLNRPRQAPADAPKGNYVHHLKCSRPNAYFPCKKCPSCYSVARPPC